MDRDSPPQAVLAIPIGRLRKQQVEVRAKEPSTATPLRPIISDEARARAETNRLAALARRKTAMPYTAGSVVPAPPAHGLQYKMAIVISPLSSLMVDQTTHINSTVRDLMGDDISMLGLGERGDVAQHLGEAQSDPASVEPCAMRGEYRLLYISERVVFSRVKGGPCWLEVFGQLHREGKLAYIAIDECHCTLEWGSGFRPDYARLGELRGYVPGLPMIALSASPTPANWTEIKRILRIAQDVHESSGSIFRPNLKLEVKVKGEEKKEKDFHGTGKQLAAELRPLVDAMLFEAKTEGVVGATLFYCHRKTAGASSVKAVSEVLKKLMHSKRLWGSIAHLLYYSSCTCSDTLSCSLRLLTGEIEDGLLRLGVYTGFTQPHWEHGETKVAYDKRYKNEKERDQSERRDTQLDFKAGNINVVVASDAFGMGIDHANIRRVIQVGPPKSIQILFQHFGRAGRDGKEALCQLICSPEGFNQLEARIDDDARKLTSQGQPRISEATKRRQVQDLNCLREFAATVTHCLWAHARSHWGELESTTHEGHEQVSMSNFRCGICGNCRRLFHGDHPQKDFADVIILVLMMVEAGCEYGPTPNQSKKEGREAKWNDMTPALGSSGEEWPMLKHSQPPAFIVLHTLLDVLCL
jgi:hypothetical protein